MGPKPEMTVQSVYIEKELKLWLIEYAYSMEMNPSSVIRKMLKELKAQIGQ